MEVELRQVRDFLAEHPPFDELPPDVLDRLPRSLSVRYLRRGRSFPPEDEAGRNVYVLRQGMVEVRDERDELVATYAEGDTYSSLCTGALDAERLAGRAVEDTLLYLLPCDALRELRSRHPAFDLHFTQLLRDKLRRAVEALQPASSLGGGLLTTDARSLLVRPPVHVRPESSIREAAQAMTREHVSSLLVLEGGRLRGILTDRDLRARCVAAGVPPEQPVRDVMTAGVHTVPGEALAFEALLEMTRLGVHHLPVTERGAVLGVLSTTDLVRLQSAHPVYLVGAIRRAGSVRALAQASARIPE